jgi:hypothetical protein
MTDPATGQRSYIQALKVPFDLKGVALGALAFLVLVLGGRAIAPDAGPRALLDLGRDWWETPLRPWRLDRGEVLSLVALYLAVAVTFGVACARIAGMRLARDEGVEAGRAFSFAIRNLGAGVSALLFMAGSMGLFYALNALAGFLCGIPGLGPFAMWLLFPLALLSSLVLYLLAFGSLLGLPLVIASLAVERNGALDAVSRAFSYVFSRPVLFFAYLLTVGFIGGVVLLGAVAGIEALAGWSFTHWYPSGESHREVAEALRAALGAVRNLRMPEFAGVEGAAVVGGWAAWLFGMLLHLALMGWVTYYAYGGGTAAYFALRRDVDGTEDEEIWVEGEEARFDEPERPSPAPPASPPAEGAKPSS